MVESAIPVPDGQDTSPRQSRDLCVDLDGTLLLTDTFFEGALQALFNQPLSLLRALLVLTRGRAHAKQILSDHSVAGVQTYPEHAEFVIWLEGQAALGRRLHLVTAADQGVADAVAARFRIFETATGSSDGLNLKGPAKRDALMRRFPAGYSYSGDSPADLPVFAGAESVVLVGASRATAKRTRKLQIGIEAEFPSASSGVREWLRAMRLHQWAKNILMFVPLLLSGLFVQGEVLAQAGLGFLCMGVCASGTYLINDLSDLDSDRRHDRKRRRPFASGKLKPEVGLGVGIGLVAIGILAALWLQPAFGLLLICYTVATLSYSLALKRLAIVDVSLLAALYTLRLIMGAALAKVPLSEWLVTFSLAFFVSLSLAKRQTEIVKAARVSSGPIPGRGYRTEDAGLTLSLGVATAMTALLVLVLFLVFQAFRQPNYVYPYALWTAPILIYIWTSRIWLMASRGELEDDPVIFAVKDKFSMGLGLLLAASLLVAVLGVPFR